MIYACPECSRMISENADSCPKCGEPDAGRKARDYYDTYTRPRLEQEREVERDAKQRIEEYHAKERAFEKKATRVGIFVGIVLLFCVRLFGSWSEGTIAGVLGVAAVCFGSVFIRKKYFVLSTDLNAMLHEQCKQPFRSAWFFCEVWVGISVLTGLFVFLYLSFYEFDTRNVTSLAMSAGLGALAGYLMHALGDIVKAILVTAEKSVSAAEKRQEMVDLLKAVSEEVVPFGQYGFFWEKKFSDALKGAGINTVSQYQLDGHGKRLGLAIPLSKIDIKVDGEKYHRNAGVTQKAEDHWLDSTTPINAAGWTLIRFRVYELREDMAGCVERVKKLIAEQQKTLLTTT